MITINLKSETEHINEADFHVGMVNGRKVLTLLTRRRADDISVCFRVFTQDLLESPRTVYGPIIGENGYIHIEAGGYGFDVSEMAFWFTALSIDNDIYDINITNVNDTAKAQMIFEAAGRTGVSLLTDFINAMNKNLLFGYKYIEPRILFDAYKSTPFINLPQDGIHDKCRVWLLANGGFELSDSGKSMGIINGTDGDVVNKGSLVYRKNGRVEVYIEVLEIIDFAHDLRANFAAVLKRLFRYPFDAAQIKEKFPEFYEKECVKDMLLELKYEDVPYINLNCAPGSNIICQKLREGPSEPSIETGVLQFYMMYKDDAKDGELKLCGNLICGEKTYLRLHKDCFYCAAAEANSALNILFYKYEKNVRYENEYYGVLKYYGETGFNEWADVSPLNIPIFRGAQYLLHNGMLNPIKVDRAEFEKAAKYRECKNIALADGKEG